MTSLGYALNGTRATSLVLLALALSAATVFAEETETLTLDARDLRMLKIDAGPGFLDIEGTGGDLIEVRAEIMADSGDYQLSLDRRGDRAVLISEVEPWAAIFLAEWPRINLRVKVPAHLALDIDDSSGYIQINGMRASMDIDDGSGDIIVRNHVGDMAIDDGSGDIDVAGVRGNLNIEDGSGPIVARNIVGDVRIKDGSGSMEVNNVDGRVTIRDGSGSIEVSDVTRGLNIIDGGSGSLHTHNIGGGIERD